MRLALVALASFALGCLATVLVRGGGAADGAAATARRGTREEQATRARLEETVAARDAEVARLEERVRELHAASAARAAAPSAGGESGGTKGAPPPEAAAGRTRFVYAGTEEALRGMEWDKAGASLVKLAPVLDELVRVMNEGAPARPDLLADITTHAAPLYTIGIALETRGIPGAEGSDLFSHPSVTVNLIHATLARAGRPLGEEQEQRLYEIGLRSLEAERRRVEGYAGDALQLDRMLDEVELKAGFFRAVDGILTDEQRTILRPERVRGRVGIDVFSAGIVWSEHVKFLTFKDRARLEEKCLEKCKDDFGLAGEQLPAAQAAVAAWSEAMSDAFLAAGSDALTTEDMPETARVTAMARLQAALQHRLLRDAALTDKQAARVRAYGRVLVPLRK